MFALDRHGHFETMTVGGEQIRSFVPHPLPPVPPIDLTSLQASLDRANQALGRLDGLATVLPAKPLFLYMYIRKEALLSSQIEGTQSSLSDLLLFEADELPGAPIDDVREVSSYVAAMDHGLSRLAGGFPLSLRLFREIHALLLRDGRGGNKEPGEFRRSQNWIGGSRPGNAAFVPPVPHRLMECLGQLETFIHRQEPYVPTLIKAGLLHVQFESIHPFLDGNGRLGRLLITLFLVEQGILREPLLYLSLFLKQNRAVYYDLLQQVRQSGAWERWLDFFLDGIVQTAEQAADTARRLLSLFELDRTLVEGLGRGAPSALRVHQFMQSHPLVTIGSAARSLRTTVPTIGKALEHLRALGIVHETTGRERGRLFGYTAYLDLLNAGTEPLPVGA